MTGPELLRARHDPRAVRAAGATVVSITAKDKLRQQLGKDLDRREGNVNFSVRVRGASARCRSTGIERRARASSACRSPTCTRWSSRCSCSRPASSSSRARRPDILLPLADRLRAAQVRARRARGESLLPATWTTAFGALAELGAIVALTADHGMNDKSNADGKPNVIWLQDILDARFGKGTRTVICPITDRFVGHHGALGRLRARVLPRPAAAGGCHAGWRASVPGIQTVYDKATAARLFDLPLDREGDVVVIATRTRASAPRRRTTTCPDSRATACARTAASRRRRCRSS